MNDLKHGLMENDDIKILWHEDYYDGPLNGFLEYHSDKYHFQVVDELQYMDEINSQDDINVYIRARIYYVYGITKKQFAYYKEWNDYFEKCKNESQTELAKFYQKREESFKSFEPNKNKLVGYFVDIPRTKNVHVYKII